MRVEGATKELLRLAEQAPSLPVRALVSFKTRVRPKQALEWSEGHGLKATTLFHACTTEKNTFRGGYFVVPGESRAEAVAHYSARYRAVLEGHAKVVRQSLETPPTQEKGDLVPDQRSVEQYHVLLQDLSAQLATFEREGIPVYGIEVVGTPVQIRAFQTRNDQVRLIEPLGKGQPAVPLLPNE
jgi:hypothetical protein